ncbi:hypothetical protein ACLOJK_005632 [Asimina triloba]
MDYEQRLKAAAHFVLSNDRSDESPPSKNSTDLGISATLKPHQLEGVAWLIRRYTLGVNVILGSSHYLILCLFIYLLWTMPFELKDLFIYVFFCQMGLGKTLQAIALLSYLKVHKMSPGPFLVLCPLSVTDGWMSEFTNFCPSLRVLRYVGDKVARRDLRRKAWGYVKQQLSSLDVLYNVLEEHFVMPRRLLMTGTPIQNNLSELWALLHFCMPLIFGTLEQFLSTFKDAGISSEAKSAGHATVKVKEQLRSLKYMLRAFMLRRTKSMLVEKGTLFLPPLTEITVMAPLVPLQKKVYLSILRRELPALLTMSSGASSHQSLQNTVIQLRKACSHPYLFSGIEPEPYEEGEHLVQASGKLIILDHLLQKLHAAGHRVLLFAQMTHTLDILQDFLELRKYTYERLDGSIRAEERFAAIRSFSQQPFKGTSKTRADEPGAFVFMISTRAGGVGLNLVAADTVIFYEQDWNPQVDKQALQRAHRIGQVNHVLSINLVSAHTVEEIIMRRAERKLLLSHNVVGREEVTHEEGKDAGSEASDLRSLIFGLHMFDPTEIHENSDGVNVVELNAMAEKVIEMRAHEQSDKSDENDRRFEINPKDLLSGDDKSVKRISSSVNFDPSFDESSYLSWIEKFKEASQSIDSSAVELGRRSSSETRHQKHEADHKKAEEKKLLKWEALGYKSLAVDDPVCSVNDDIMSDSGSVEFVYGDCTKPSKTCSSEPTIIFRIAVHLCSFFDSCVDDSGSWGHGGMFDALANLSGSVADAYHQASEFRDLHLGDLHLIKVNEDDDENNRDGKAPQWVALAIVQSYSRRRKVPRSNVSMPDLERCLRKLSYSAAQNSGTLPTPLHFSEKVVSILPMKIDFMRAPA